ncbi:MAG: AAA family ATPase [Candidatus Eisenbacteria bacterium]
MNLLVGPNGSGKSTLLDAAYAAASTTPFNAVIHILQRHPGVVDSPRWCVWKSGAEGPASVRMKEGESFWGVDLQVDRTSGGGIPSLRARHYSHHGYLDATVDYDRGSDIFSFSLPPGGDAIVRGRGARMVEATGHDARTLVSLYSEAVEQGKKSIVTQIVASVVPDLEDLEILSDHGQPILHLRFADRSVPAAFAGDGVHAMLRLVAELSGIGSGLALVEEPEVHQHPRSLREIAKAVAAAADLGLQLFITTHSMEFLDALLAGLGPARSDELALYRVALAGGMLSTTRVPGADVLEARDSIQDDMR